VTDRDRGNSLAAWLAPAPEIRAERWEFLPQPVPHAEADAARHLATKP